ncbi:hypothetical protein OG705_11695 [Streptomyces sp. NBC_00838]|uniref:hypothetical protein n=1 Tax=Streptomyces sp. NBC_00838 TaxID=2903680 RepID=UPI003866EA00|nr:hypothetical protein OG705_11695 [Streptomyces sp. NBC_00838]
MARTVTGAGKVTVLPLLHTWPDQYGVLTYATSGAFGDTAIVGYIPIVDIPDMPLMDIAARHQPTRVYSSAGGSGFAEACWLMCVGWSGRLIRKPGTLELSDAAWSLEVDATTELFKTMYGHDRLHVGRMTLNDPELTAKAREVLPAGARSVEPVR